MNKLTKFSRAILAIAIMLCVALPTFAHDFEVGGIYYNYLDNTAKTVEVTYKGSNRNSYYDEYSGSVIIPSSVTYDDATYSVTSIGSSAFSGCSGLTSVTIPNSVTSIGSSAFSGCSGLTSVTIPNSVTTIGSSAFSGCSGLTSVTIPNSVTSIGYSAFYGTAWYNNLADGVIYINNVLYKYKGSMPNGTSISVKDGTVSISTSAFEDRTGLTSVTIPNSVTTIGSSAFSGCSGLTSVTIPNSVTSIGSAAFSNCTGLTSVTIPNSVTTISSYAFSNCTGLTSITIPNSVTSIGSYAFYGCTGLTEVNISDLSAWCKIDFGSSGANPLNYAKKLKLNGTEIKDLVIPNDITEINGSAFYGYDGLTSVIIPNSVTSIGESAFSNCSGLTSITIPNSVTSICSFAFYRCSGLTSVTIPNSVTTIGSSAFCDCSGLTEVNFNAENCTMGSYNYPVFENCPNLKTINIGNSVKTIPKYAFEDCSGLSSVTIPNSVTTIGESAFSYCSGLTEVNISDLSAWCKIDFGNYDANPLYYAKEFKLNGIEIKDLVIPNDVTEIKDYVFYGCSGLTSLTIGNSVTSIGEYAFYCNNLRIVKSLSNTPQQCNDNAFGSNPAALLMVPKGSMMSYMIADGWRHFTKIQEYEVEDAVKPVLTIAYPEGGVIKQKVDNGTILELQIVPSNGWKCNSVTFNGVDVTNNLDADGNYNTPSITADSQLSIVFVKNDGGVESTLANDIKVCVNGNTVTILGADEFDDVDIYNTSGINVYNGIEKSITLDSNGIYILTVEGETFKFAM